MRPSKFSEAEIVQALKQVRDGASAVGVCRKLGITQTTFYRWRNKYDCDGTAVSREVRELREENRKLKIIVADLLLGNPRSAEPRAKATTPPWPRARSTPLSSDR
jgi:putative transposase